MMEFITKIYCWFKRTGLKSDLRLIKARFSYAKSVISLEKQRGNLSPEEEQEWETGKRKIESEIRSMEFDIDLYTPANDPVITD